MHFLSQIFLIFCHHRCIHKKKLEICPKNELFGPIQGRWQVAEATLAEATLAEAPCQKNNLIFIFTPAMGSCIKVVNNIAV
jgi:hypothetical protein